MKWIDVSICPPCKNIFWCRPTIDPRGYSALYWNGTYFSAGKFKPDGLTHYCEMKLEDPPRYEMD